MLRTFFQRMRGRDVKSKSEDALASSSSSDFFDVAERCVAPNARCSRRCLENRAESEDSEEPPRPFRRAASTAELQEPSGREGGRLKTEMSERGGGSAAMSRRALVLPPKSSSKRLAPLSQSTQCLILFCMDSAKADLAARILDRVVHKRFFQSSRQTFREDFAFFYASLSGEQRAELTLELQTFILECVKYLHSSEKLSFSFGVRQVAKRSWGFKADFFAAMANEMTQECIYLDGATHQPTETIEAWTQLLQLMFSNVRDGYYQQESTNNSQMRFLRRTSQCFGALNRSSDLSTEDSEAGDVSLSSGVVTRL